MSEQAFDLGAKVGFRDGKEGRLTRVVVDPQTQRVVDLIVQYGLLMKHSWVIPTDRVLSIDTEAIHLNLLSTELPSYPAFSEVDYDTAGDEEVVARPAIENVRYWTGYYSVFVDQPVVPSLHHHVPVGIPSNLARITRRMAVRNHSGLVGHIDHLLVEPESWTLTHLVVRRGLFPYDLIIPMDWVEAVEDAIYINCDNDQLRLLPLYRPRPVSEVLEELEYRFEVAQPDFSHVHASLEEGVLQLKGEVVDEAERAEAEQIGRSVSGVLVVDNRLQTNGALLADVSRALLVDPRTHNEVIEVHNDRGVIALHGAVTSGAVRKAAAEIAAQQHGVISVINALEVKVEKARLS